MPFNWDNAIDSFKSFLKIEKSLSQNTIDAYLRDINLPRSFLKNKPANLIQLNDLQEFLLNINKSNISKIFIK